MKNIVITSGIILFILASCAKRPSKNVPVKDPRAQWVDSVYKTMSLQEKVGQLFMVAAYSNRNQSHADSIEKLIKDHHIGGLIFFQGGPIRQARLTNQFQSQSKLPLFIGIDGEWGLNMRLDSTAKYPYNMTLGAIKDDHILNLIGKQIGEDCNRMGIHINFAPDVDINTNSINPVIGVRSFGEDKVNVTEKSWAFTEGMQSTGVLACAKHFPGHGDTDTDSHKTLPTVSFSAERIDEVELYPYKMLFEKGIAGVMVAHLNVPSLEKQQGLPSSLSYSIVTELLKEKLNYKGLIFTDALNMKGASDYGESGDIDMAAFQAGNDVLLFSENAPKAIAKIMEAYNNKEISEARLAHSVKKIIEGKYNVGLNAYKPIVTENLYEDLNGSVNGILYNAAITDAITVVKNQDDILPIQKNAVKNTAFLQLGDGNGYAFLTALQLKGEITDVSKLSRNELLEEINNFDRIIISYHRKNSRLTNAISEEDKHIIETLSKTKTTLLTVFASQYSLKETQLDNVESILIAYENSEAANRISADVIFGDTDAQGTLPASISKAYPVGLGIDLIK